MILSLNGDLPMCMKKLPAAGKRKKAEGRTIPEAHVAVRIVNSCQPMWKDFVIVRSLSKILRKLSPSHWD